MVAILTNQLPRRDGMLGMRWFFASAAIGPLPRRRRLIAVKSGTVPYVDLPGLICQMVGVGSWSGARAAVRR